MDEGQPDKSRRESDKRMGDSARHHNYTVDLNKPLQRHFCGVLLASGDNEGDDFIFTVKRDGTVFKPEVLPIMRGYFLRSDGVTVRVTGSHLSGDGVVTVTLDKKCYACEGRFTLTAKLLNYPDVTTTVAIIDGYIRKTSTGTVVLPDGENASGGTSWASVPAYWQTHIDERVNDTNAAMSAAAGNRSAFLFYTDAHWTINYQKSPALLKYLAQNTAIKKVFYGGDIIGEESDLWYLEKWREAVSELPCHHSVAGNHDDSIDDTWTLDTVYQFLLKPEITADVVRGDDLYYYIDAEGEKTRYLFLDTATKTGNILNDSAQEAWLKRTLLSVPAGWHVVAIAHTWKQYNSANGVYTAQDGFTGGGTIALDMFDAYNARTGDFASCTGKVEFCIGGHLHWDADYVSNGGIPVILVACDSYGVRNGATASGNTITESSVNAIVADYTAGVVKVIRVGRGNSRTVQLDGSGSVETTDYDLIAPTGNFTNMLDVATEADGKTLYNGGHGYKNDVRFSTTSNSETAATGWDLSGYFPVKKGDVLRFKNVEFMDMADAGGVTKRNTVLLFNSDFSYNSNSANYTPDNLPTAAWNPAYGDDGDIVQLMIPTSYGDGIAYCRICAKNLTGASVITVNEAIE